MVKSVINIELNILEELESSIIVPELIENKEKVVQEAENKITEVCQEVIRLILADIEGLAVEKATQEKKTSKQRTDRDCVVVTADHILNAIEEAADDWKYTFFNR